MKRLLFLFSILIGLAFSGVAYADPPPALQTQPRSDTFASGVAAHPDLAFYNALHQKVEQTGTVLWAYKVEPGCTDGGGTIARNIGGAMGDLYNKTSLASLWIPSDAGVKPDLTIHINCGASATAVGIGNGVIGCLCRNFPYNLDIDLLQDMKDYPDLTQISIVCHEYCGHALSTFNEQYCPGYNAALGCSGLFAAVPGWSDIMNTGPDSRHLLGDVELARWGRVHGTPAPANYGVDPSGFLWFCSPSAKALGVWIDGVGSVMLSDLHAVNGCYGVSLVGYLARGTTFTFTLGNMVDWSNPLFRSDRQATWS